MTLNRIINLMKERKLSQRNFAEKLGLNPQVVTNWKNGNNESYKKFIPQIAEILETNVDYLLGTSDQKEKAHLSEGELNETERAVLKSFRSLNEENQRLFLEFLAKL